MHARTGAWLAAILLGLGAAPVGGCHCEWQPPDFVLDDPGPDGIGGDDPLGDQGPDEDERPAAELLAVQGDRIYALSAVGGLTVIDGSAPGRELPVLGRLRLPARPVALFVDEDHQVVVLTNDHVRFETTSGSASGRWIHDGRLLAIEAEDPAAMQVRSEHEIPGRIDAAHRVGDVVYTVAFEDGSCWQCAGGQPRTVVSSYDVSEPDRILTVEQLVLPEPAAEPGPQSEPRPVVATDQRLYVARSSIIDVIDVSDPDGRMVRGASIEVAGSITAAWQIDEHQGVLRVVSQPSRDREDDRPVLETFDASSAASATGLAALTLPISPPSRLQALRFDGPRAYAVTFDRDAPLLTLDLSDPEAPAVAGSLAFPGFVQQLEPRGDRLLALGYDPDDSHGSLSLRLFDVRDPSAPVLQSRQTFAGPWPSRGEDPERLHPAMTVLDDEGLVVVPFDAGSCGPMRGGTQLLDWRADVLRLRGLAASRGMPRTALLHRDHLLTVSAHAMQSFDVSDRDRPAARAEATLAVHVAMVAGDGNSLVRLTEDWWSGALVLEVVSPADPSVPQPRGRLALHEPSDEPSCDRSWPIELWVDDGWAHLLRQSHDPQTRQPTLALDTFDVTPPWSPRWLHTLALPVALPPDRFDDTGSAPLGFGAERPVVRVGDRLAVSTSEARYSSDGEYLGRAARLDVVDLDDPARPRLAATLMRPPALAHGELQVLDDTVVSWHMDEALDEPGKVRLYLDRFDLSTPDEPVAEPPINVPGQVVSYADVEGRAVVVSFSLETLEAEPARVCAQRANFWSYDEGSSTCTVAHRPLELVSLGSISAARIDRFDAEARGGRLTGVLASAERMFVTTHDRPDASDRAPDRLYVLTGHDGDVLHEGAPMTLPDDDPTRLLVTVGPVALLGSRSGLVLVDARSPERLEPTFVPTHGPGCLHVAVVRDVAYCALGAHGLQAIPLP